MVAITWQLLLVSLILPLTFVDDDDLSFDFGWSIDQCVDQDQQFNAEHTNQMVPLFFSHGGDSLDCEIPALHSAAIRTAQSTSCCSNRPHCCSLFTLHRIYQLRTEYRSMLRPAQDAWLLAYVKNSAYILDKMVCFIYFFRSRARPHLIFACFNVYF